MQTTQSITAERILKLRQQQGWTQQELAEKAELERKSILRYENGQNAPNGRALIALASVFGVTADYLLGISDDPYPIAASDADLSPLEREAVQAFRRATSPDQRERLLAALNALVPSDTP